MTWLTRLRRAWPNVTWDDDRITGYVDALDGTEHRHLTATIDNLLRGGWAHRYPPPAATLRYMVDEVRREEAANRGNEAAAAHRNQQSARPVAGPWHANLWRVWLQHSLGHTIHPDDRPYLAVIERHQLTPEAAGVRWTRGPDLHLVTVPELVEDANQQAILDAEGVWRASGSAETAEQAALRALGAMGATTIR